VAPTGPLPETLDDWLRTASTAAQVYAQAACEVSRWTATHDLRALVAAGPPIP
jgi:predicted DNA-binding transcriptional regulator YafY